MSVIIRLQNLPWSANAHDIREFFKGLGIPEGGVHIVGGELGDAFIAFSSDEDARLAMRKTGNSLKGIQISLLLSSRSEMQKVIETARQQAMGIQSFGSAPAPPVVEPPNVVPPTQPQFHQPPPVTILNQRHQHEEQAHQNPPNPNMIFQDRPTHHNQPFGQPFGTQPQMMLPNQLSYQGQRMTGFPPGVVPPSGIPSQFFVQPPPTTPAGSSSTPVTSPPSNHMRLPSTDGASPVNVSQQPFAPGMNQHVSSYQMGPVSNSNQGLDPLKQGDPNDKREQKSNSVSASSGRDKRERERGGRDDRRRRSKSRSRSRDRDRRRRHRTRSRSRSRDRSGRRKRSRSRDRDRTRDKERERQRDRDKGRSHRDGRPDKMVMENPEMKAKAVEIAGGIPGLGDIPDDIPKEGLSIFSTPSNKPVQSQEPLTSSGWPRKEPIIPDVPDQFESTELPDGGDGQQPMSKPFLLSNPPSNVFNRGNPPMSSTPPQTNIPQGSRSFQNSPSFPPEEGEYGNNSRESLPPFPKDRDSPGYSGERREWSQEFEPKRSKENDRPYRNQEYFRERGDRSSNDFNRNEWDSKKDMDKGPPRDEWNRPFSRRDDKYEYSRGRGEGENWVPEYGGSSHDQREHNFSNRGNYQDKYGPDYEDRYGRGGFRGGRGRRGGGFGRDGDRDLEPPRGFRDEDPNYRDRFGSDFDSGRGRGRGFMRGRGGRMPPGSDFPRERRVRTCSVEILHVPLHASYRAIRELFTGIMVPNGSIKILGDSQGSRIGVALIQFSSTRDAHEAFKRSGEYIFDSQVQINFIDDGFYMNSRDVSEFNNRHPPAIDLEDTIEHPEITTCCLYVSSLPVGCTDHDVGKVFENHKIEDIILELEKGNRQPTGGCFVRLSSAEEARLTFEQMQDANIDGTPIKIEYCLPEAMEIAAEEREKIRNFNKSSHLTQRVENSFKTSDIGTKEHLNVITQSLMKNYPNSKTESKNSPANENENSNIDSNDQNGDNANDNKMGTDLLTDSVVVKNVSSDVTETTIRDFFSDEGLIPEKIYFNRPDSEGKCDVFVIFPKIFEAKRAVQKNGQQLGSTKVTVELVSKPKVMLAMDLPFNPLELFQKGQTENESEQIPNENVRHKSPENDQGFRMNKERIPHSSRFDPSLRGRGTYNNKFPRAHEPTSFESYKPRQQMPFRKEPDPNFPEERKSYEERVILNGKEVINSSEPPENFGKTGCVVALANVPYQASTEDIISFFKDFDGLLPENIIRRYDEKNRPTSDSRVSLTSPEDAINAVETLNRKFMLGRPIYVSLVN